MATAPDSSTPQAPPEEHQVLTIWLAGAEVAELRAEMERRNAEREKTAARMGQIWRPLDLGETAEALIAELLRAGAKARQEGGAQ